MAVLKKNDREWLNERPVDVGWVRRNAHHINNIHYVIARKYLDHNDAQEVAQESFIKTIRGVTNFDQVKCIKPWLNQIGYNSAIDQLRKNFRGNRATSYDKTNRIDGKLVEILVDRRVRPPLEGIIVREYIDIMRIYVRNLPEGLRSVFEMVKLKGATYQETADYFGIPRGSVSSRINRVMGKLKKKFSAI
jgi:RNA polymerase sigma-70 factor, ECF subfamily